MYANKIKLGILVHVLVGVANILWCRWVFQKTYFCKKSCWWLVITCHEIIGKPETFSINFNHKKAIYKMDYYFILHAFYK